MNLKSKNQKQFIEFYYMTMFINNSHKYNSEIYLFINSIIVSICFGIAYYFVGFVAIFPILYFVFYKFFDIKFVTLFAIVSFLTLSSNLSTALRVSIQVLNFGVLLYLFIKRYGLDIKAFPKIYKPLFYFIILLLLSMSVSTIFSGYYVLGGSQIFRTILFFILVYIFYSNIQSNQIVKVYISSIIIASVVAVIILFYEFSLVGFNFLKLNEQLLEVGKFYYGKNAIGALLVIAFSLITVFLFDNKFRKWYPLIYLFDFILVIGLLITNSRAAIGALLISLLFILYKLQPKLLKKLIIFLLIISPFLFLDPVSDSLSLYFRLDTVSTGRDWILNSVYKVIERNPLLGSGPAGTKLEFYKQIPYMLGSPQELLLARNYKIEFGHAHNFYLFLFSDLGVPGLILSFYLPIIFLKIAFNVIFNFQKKGSNNRSDERRIYLLIIGITGTGIGLFVRGFFEWGNLLSYGQINTDLPFWLLFAIILYYKKIVTK